MIQIQGVKWHMLQNNLESGNEWGSEETELAKSWSLLKRGDRYLEYMRSANFCFSFIINSLNVFLFFKLQLDFFSYWALSNLISLYSPWNSPGQNTGVGSLSLLQGNLPNSGIKTKSPVLQVDSLPSEPLERPTLYSHHTLLSSKLQA